MRGSNPSHHSMYYCITKKPQPCFGLMDNSAIIVFTSSFFVYWLRVSTASQFGVNNIVFLTRFASTVYVLSLIVTVRNGPKLPAISPDNDVIFTSREDEEEDDVFFATLRASKVIISCVFWGLNLNIGMGCFLTPTLGGGATTAPSCFYFFWKKCRKYYKKF